MTNKLKERIHLFYGIAVGIAAVIAGVCFIVSAYNIYQAGLAAGTQPYTTDTIAAAFARIAVPVYICLALVIGGIILQAALPREKKKCLPEKNLPLILQRLQAKTDLAACEAGLQAAIAGQARSRKLWGLISGLLLAVGSGLFLSYACNGDNWPQVVEAAKINTHMVRAVFAMAICLVLPFAACVFTAFYCRRSYQKEIELMKQANAQAPIQGNKPGATVDCCGLLAFCNQAANIMPYVIRYSVLLLAVGLIVFGACTGGTADVLAKAAAICTECVGLG